MNASEYDCVICFDVCLKAVESICCGVLFCKKCANGIKQCPSCRKDGLEIFPSRAIRRLIGRTKVPCQFCGMSVQRDSVADHLDVCKRSPLKCAARGCEFSGVMHEILEHVVDAHKTDILTITKGTGKTHVFQLPNADVSVQKVPDTRDIDIQTEAMVLTPTLLADTTVQCLDGGIEIEVACSNSGEKTTTKIDHLCPCPKPVKGSHGKYYCGRQLGSLCPCKNVYGTRSDFECQQGMCGPTYGHNCARCMRLDLQERGLPLQGYVISAGNAKTNLRTVSTCVWKEAGYSDSCCTTSTGGYCNLYKSMCKEPTSIYNAFR